MTVLGEEISQFSLGEEEKIINNGIGTPKMVASAALHPRQTNVQCIYILMQADEMQWYAQNLNVLNDPFRA